MSQVQLQIRPRRVRCDNTATPPPFRFATSEARAEAQAEGGRSLALVRAPLKGVGLLCLALGKLIDLAFFLVVLTVWCALHLVLWSYAFDMGPAADCFTLPCPGWVAHRVLLACGALAVITFIGSSLLRRLGHRATSIMMLVLVTLDVAALLLLGASLIG